MVSIRNVIETLKFYFQWLLDLGDIHLGDHSFSRQIELSAKLVFFILPDTHMCICVSEGKNCQFFGEILVRIKWMIHWIIFLPIRNRGESKENNLENSADLFMIFLQPFLFQSSWFLDDQTIVVFYFINIPLCSSILVYS